MSGDWRGESIAAAQVVSGVVEFVVCFRWGPKRCRETESDFTSGRGAIGLNLCPIPTWEEVIEGRVVAFQEKNETLPMTQSPVATLLIGRLLDPSNGTCYGLAELRSSIYVGSH